MLLKQIRDLSASRVILSEQTELVKLINSCVCTRSAMSLIGTANPSGIDMSLTDNNRYDIAMRAIPGSSSMKDFEIYNSLNSIINSKVEEYLNLSIDIDEDDKAVIKFLLCTDEVYNRHTFKELKEDIAEIGVSFPFKFFVPNYKKCFNLRKSTSVLTKAFTDDELLRTLVKQVLERVEIAKTDPVVSALFEMDCVVILNTDEMSIMEFEKHLAYLHRLTRSIASVVVIDDLKPKFSLTNFKNLVVLTYNTPKWMDKSSLTQSIAKVVTETMPVIVIKKEGEKGLREVFTNLYTYIF